MLGLETEIGQLPPKPDAWKILTPADALRLIEPFPDQSRRPVVGRWPWFTRTFRPEELPIALPFLTRGGSLGILELSLDRTDRKDQEVIRWNYQIARVQVAGGGELVQGRSSGRLPSNRFLDDHAGPVSLQVWKGGIVLTRPGSPEWIEIDRGKVVVKVNRAGLAGPDAAAETLIEASRLVTDVMDLDGRRLRTTIAGTSKRLICRRVRDQLEIGEDGLEYPSQKFQARKNTVLSCDRITLDLPNFKDIAKDPKMDAIVRPRR